MSAPCPGSGTIPRHVSSDFARCFCDMCGRMYATNTDGTVRRHAHDYELFLRTMARAVRQACRQPWQFGSSIR